MIVPFVAFYAFALLLAAAIAAIATAPLWTWGLAFVFGANSALLVLLAIAAVLADLLAKRKHIPNSARLGRLTLWGVAGLVIGMLLSVPLQSVLLITAERGWEPSLIGELVQGPWFIPSLLVLGGAYLLALALRLLIARATASRRR